ncbi:MAG: M48 family metalloprotease [Pseudomonadota bacterium]
MADISSTPPVNGWRPVGLFGESVAEEPPRAEPGGGSKQGGPAKRRSRAWAKWGKRAASALAFAAALAVPVQASARGLIRDSEIERTLQMMIQPIFKAAGLPSDRVRLFIVQENTLNAFVAAGNNMFFHTGLLQQLETPEELIGVMAHETGHVQAGHFVQRVEAVRTLSTASLLATLVGIGAAAAGGGSAGAGIIQGGNRVLTRNLLRFTRGQETGADALAVQYMTKANVDPSGMLAVLRRLGEAQAVFLSNVDPYALSHPLSTQRIAALEKSVAASPALGARVSEDIRYWHGRMRAKLDGFLSPAGSGPSTFYGDPELDLYRRAIALHRAPRPDEAIAAVDKLIQMRPNDPFYWELKGQFLFESGRGPKAVQPYERATRLAPNEPLIAAGLGRSLLTVGTPAANKRALRVLERAAVADPFDPGLRRPLADAYARNGQEGMAAVVTAERLVLGGRIPDAHRQAQRAKALLPAGSPGWIRADDVLTVRAR